MTAKEEREPRETAKVAKECTAKAKETAKEEREPKEAAKVSKEHAGDATE